MGIYIFFWIISLSISPFIRRRVGFIFFYISVFLFVGFRYETGFDWPVYKSEFDYFKGGISFNLIRDFSNLYQQEIGYTLISAMSSHIFPYYEIFQATISGLFLLSISRLCAAFQVKNSALVVSIALTFLLLTLGFSTNRQCLAVALFNFGLVAYVRKKFALTTIFFLVAVSCQSSSLVYILAFLVSIWHVRRLPRLYEVVGLVVIAFILIFNLQYFSRYLPGSFADRIAFYANAENGSAVGLWGIFLLLMFFGMAAYALISAEPKDTGAMESNLIRRLIISLAVIASASWSFLVIRDRTSYELFLLFCILICHPKISFALPARLVTAGMGCFFSTLSVLSPPADLVFAPYQNFIVSKFLGVPGNAESRQKEFMEEFAKIYK